MFFAVPRVWEKMYEAMQEVRKATPLPLRVVSDRLKRDMKAYVLSTQFGEEEVRPALLPLAEKMFDKVKEKLGLDRTRYCATGKCVRAFVGGWMGVDSGGEQRGRERPDFGRSWPITPITPITPTNHSSHHLIISSGAAPLSAEIQEYFASLGVTIFEVFGQSEATGLSTCNCPRAWKLGKRRKGTGNYPRRCRWIDRSHRPP